MHRLLAILLFLAVPGIGPVAAQPDDVRERLRRLDPRAMDEVVWLARCILSESDHPHEQRLVAWVVRNRVETGFRGTTYRDVVLEPRQFSAFNDPTPRRAYLLSLDAYTDNPAWHNALKIALDVYEAPPGERPFPITVRHFYSPVSMQHHEAPPWARLAAPLDAARLGVDPARFRFFDGIDETLDPAPASTRAARVAEQIERRHRDRRTGLSSLRERMRSRLSGRVPRPARPRVGHRQP
ncbi:cell wall hydrolase [Rhodocaloribacter litoris]|uniref:cell wall hydrolase n=1 Tax=Rhodocaloribacter litoris TaxID=2558931 RepID=UPI00142042C5|nr:cell wall hydrolase [Rhodocaloribacter litoris]QXD15058.1 cell wall hydrolase [Rhodocaloribacter litoris]